MEGVIDNKAQKKKIHPQKFALWLALGSIAMMFGGFTSAYVVRKAQGNWVLYQLPLIFWFSTVVIILSSVTMVIAVRSFKNRRMPLYNKMVGLTLLLGILFGVCQYLGFKQLYAENIKITGNPSESFLFVIFIVHLLHIAGGVIALLIKFLMDKRKNIKVYNTVGLELVATYWHFVDVLWIYLFVFFLANQ
jgi:cytochrome c oxidase subunit 3